MMNPFAQMLSHRGAVEPPWEGWELDKDFFQSLSRYREMNPNHNSKLGKVLDKINKGLSKGDDLYEMIPEGPFPARSIVIALGCLIKLGISVARVKKYTYDFATKVASWVEDVQTAFQGDDHGEHFTWTTWRSLRKASELINEICLWACARLDDGRWKQIVNGLRVGKEINDFNHRLTESKELFRDLSLIHLSGGVSRITGEMEDVKLGVKRLNKDMNKTRVGMQTLSSRMKTFGTTMKSIVLRQDDLLKEIRKVRRQHRDQLALIMDEMDAKKQADERRVFLEQKLDNFVVANPTFKKQGKIPCDRDTRVAELADIHSWLHATSSGSQNFLWMTGKPGCGKSAITASLAEYCLEHPDRVLLTQFFINRNNKETTDPNSYFPSIARQLADQCPEVEQALYNKLQVQPALTLRMTTDQAMTLFVETFAVAAKAEKSRIIAVVIDGLDETDKTRLHETASIFAYLFKELSRYPNVKVFISSRIEEEIRNPFSPHLKETNNVKQIHLDTASSVKDVAFFLRRKVSDIVEHYDLNWEEWPGEDRMVALGERASGLFIWAVTAVRYIQERIENDGRECLDDVLHELTGEVLEDINALYTLILKSIFKKKHAKDWDFEKFRLIIGAIIVLKEPLCLDDLFALLNLHCRANIPVDILHFVKRLRTVLVSGTDAIDGKTVPRLHKSFFEFITDRKLFEQGPLDPRLRVDPAAAEVELAISCLQVLAGASKDRNSLCTFESFQYASRFCTSHAEAVTGGKPGLVLHDPSNDVSNIRSLLSTIRQSSYPTPMFSGEHSSMFAPLNTAYQVTTDTNTVKRLLATAPGWVNCLAYSQDGEQLVSGLDTGLLVLWDPQTGNEMGKLEGHTDAVWSVAFSPSGEHIASGSKDRTIRLWETQTRQTKFVLRGHQDSVRSVSFSNNGCLLVSGSEDKTFRVWETSSGKQIASPFQHENLVYNAAFTPDGNQVISNTSDGHLHVWDKDTGKRRPEITSLVPSVHSVAISPSRNRLAAMDNGDLRFWNKTADGFLPDDKMTLKFANADDTIFRDSSQIVFNQDGNSVTFWHNCDGKTTFLIFDLQFHATIPYPSLPKINTFAVSPNGSSVAFSKDKQIRIRAMPHITLTAVSPNCDKVVCAFSDDTIWMGNPAELPGLSSHLEGKVGKVRHITFSSDGCHLAAVDDESIYLWDVATSKLCAIGSSKTLTPATTLSFLERQTPTSNHEDGGAYTWNVEDGILHPERVEDGAPTNISFDSPLSLDVDEEHMREVAGAKWFTTMQDDSDFLAYINGCLLRRKARDGSIILLPLKATSESP